MAIDYQTLKNWRFPEIEHTYTAEDTIRTEMWTKQHPVRFRAKALEREVTVINFGELELQ